MAEAGQCPTGRVGAIAQDGPIARQTALKATTALVPPKAKPLLIAARTLRSRATFGVTSRSQSGSLVAKIGRRRHDAVADRHHAGDHFQRAGRAHAVGMHRFGRRDRQPVGMVAEDALDAARLDLVVGLGAGAMRVDVVDVLRGEPGVGEAEAHRRRRPFDGRRHDVGGIAGKARAGKFGQDRGAARHGMFVGFQHGHAGALAEHQALAIGRERPAGVARQRPQALPSPSARPRPAAHRCRRRA